MNTDDTNNDRIPCDCGSTDAYWHRNNVTMSSTYACDSCMGYNKGLDTAMELAKELPNSMDQITLLCGLDSSKKFLKVRKD